MSSHLVLSFRFLAPWFHGRGDAGEPEWPPSPLRAFQALVAAAARAGTLEHTRAALNWLEALPAPLMIAPVGTPSLTGYRLSVPHNAMDLVGRQWAAGKEGTASEHRAMKNVRPHQLPEDSVVHFAWQLSEPVELAAVDALITAARKVVALGWGVDLVAGDGAVMEGAHFAALASEPMKTWEPRTDGDCSLRAPVKGTLVDLDRRHQAFLRRTSFEDPTLRPPPAISSFAITTYARTDARPPPRIAAFTLMDPHADRMRAFDTTKKGMVVSGMLRHATRIAAENAGWSDERVRSTVMGHGDVKEPRLLLVPVPSIEHRKNGRVVSGVRRVLVTSTDPAAREVDWAQRALGGAALIDEKTGEVLALLAETSRREPTFKAYLAPAPTWATVTPVVLPGHDDPGGLRQRLRTTKNASEQKVLLARLARRQEGLVRKALRHAGFADELVFNAVIETRSVGYFAGVDRAERYDVPQHLKAFPRLHVRITWPQPVTGPLCIGRGRFSGLGLFSPIRA